MIKKFLDIFKNSKFEYVQQGLNYLNFEYKNKIIKSVKMLEFKMLYPTILVQLFDEGILPESEKTKIDEIREFLKGDTSYREDANRYFGILYSRKREYANILLKYIQLFYEDLVSHNIEKLIRIDVDRIFIKDLDHDLLRRIRELDVYFTIKDIDYFWMGRHKEYIYYSGGEFRKRSREELEQIKKEMMQKLRSDRLTEYLK